MNTTKRFLDAAQGKYGPLLRTTACIRICHNILLAVSNCLGDNQCSKYVLDNSVINLPDLLSGRFDLVTVMTTYVQSHRQYNIEHQQPLAG